MEKGVVEEQNEEFVKLVFFPVNNKYLRNKLGLVTKKGKLEKICRYQIVTIFKNREQKCILEFLEKRSSSLLCSKQNN